MRPRPPDLAGAGLEGARPACASDLEGCARILAQAAAGAVQRRGGRPHVGTTAGLWGVRDPLAPSSWHAGLARALEQDRCRLFVGTFSGCPVGVGGGRVDGPTGIVDFCYVEPAGRKVGVGTALLDALTGWFGDQGCTALDAPALPGDRESKQLYEAAGLSARLLVLRRSLP